MEVLGLESTRRLVTETEKRSALSEKEFLKDSMTSHAIICDSHSV